jgi:hypothetical protein
MKRKLIELYKGLLNQGDFQAATRVLRLLRNKRMTCFLGDIDMQLESLIEAIGLKPTSRDPWGYWVTYTF